MATTTTKRKPKAEGRPKNPILALREKAKVSQVTMARVMGISLSALAAAEEGIQEDLGTAIRDGLTLLGVDVQQIARAYQCSRGDEPDITLADVRERLGT